MTVDLYNTSSDQTTAGKLKAHLDTVACMPWGDIDIINPQIVIAYNPAFITCNYCRIPEFQNRYYFVNITLQTGGKMLLNCRCDVLETALQYIVSKEFTATRNENKDFSMIEDKGLVFTSDTELEVFRFSNSFDSSQIGTAGFDCYALSLIG